MRGFSGFRLRRLLPRDRLTPTPTPTSPSSNPGQVQRPSLDRWQLAAAGLGIGAALLLVRWGGALWHWPLQDLAVYRASGGDLLAGNGLYRSVAGLPFTYPPFAAMVFVPVHAIGPAAAAVLLSASSSVGYLVVVTVTGRRLGMPSGAVLLACGVLLALEPVLRTFRLGQVNLVLTALIVLDCLVVPARWRGLLTGVAAGIKIVPGVFVLYFALRRDWAAVARSLLGFAITVLISGFADRSDTVTFWTKLFYDPAHVGGVAYVDNQSLFGVLVRLWHTEHPPRAAAVLVQGGALLLALVAAHRRLAEAPRDTEAPRDAEAPGDTEAPRRNGDEVAAMTCVGVGGLLASPISWSHHWIWLVPALLVLVADRRLVGATVIALIGYLAPQWFTPAAGLREFHHNWWQATAASAMALSGVLFLLLMLFSRRPPPVAPLD